MFLGSLAGGYFANELLTVGLELTLALSIGFLLSAGGRVITGVAYAKLREDRQLS